MENRIRIYGRVVNTWSHWTEIDVRNPWTGKLEKRNAVKEYQWEVAYTEYYSDGTVAAVGTEDFQKPRYNDLIEAHMQVWKGKLNRGGHKVWETMKTVKYIRGNGRMVKALAREWYPNAMEIKIRNVWA